VVSSDTLLLDTTDTLLTVSGQFDLGIAEDAPCAQLIERARQKFD
jgi:hypothetical protein